MGKKADPNEAKAILKPKGPPPMRRPAATGPKMACCPQSHVAAPAPAHAPPPPAPKIPNIQPKCEPHTLSPKAVHPSALLNGTCDQGDPCPCEKKSAPPRRPCLNPPPRVRSKSTPRRRPCCPPPPGWQDDANNCNTQSLGAAILGAAVGAVITGAGCVIFGRSSSK